MAVIMYLRVSLFNKNLTFFLNLLLSQLDLTDCAELTCLPDSIGDLKRYGVGCRHSFRLNILSASTHSTFLFSSNVKS